MRFRKSDAASTPSPPVRSAALQKNLARERQKTAASGSQNVVDNSGGNKKQSNISSPGPSNTGVKAASNTGVDLSQRGGQNLWSDEVNAISDNISSESQRPIRLRNIQERRETGSRNSQAQKLLSHGDNLRSPDVTVGPGRDARRPTRAISNSRDQEIDTPFDTGWAWMIVLGTFLTLFVTYSYHYVLSSLLLDIVEELDISVFAFTALMGVIHFIYCLSTHVLVNLVMPFVPIRLLSTLSAFLYAVSTLVVVFLPYFPILCLVSIVKYIVVGGVCIPSLHLISSYFRRYRPFAVGLSLLGISAASMIIPPFARYLREEYGVRGVFLILSGWELNGVVAALLLRPMKADQEENEKTLCPPKPKKELLIKAPKKKTNGEKMSKYVNETTFEDPRKEYSHSGNHRILSPKTKLVVMTILLNDCQLLLRTVVKQQVMIPQGPTAEGENFTRQCLARSVSSSDSNLQKAELENKAYSGANAENDSLLCENPQSTFGRRRSLSCTMLEILRTDELRDLGRNLEKSEKEVPDSGFWRWFSYSSVHQMARRSLNMIWWSQATSPENPNTLQRAESRPGYSASEENLLVGNSDETSKSHGRSASDFSAMDKRDKIRSQNDIFKYDQDSEYFYDPGTLKKWASYNNILPESTNVGCTETVHDVQRSMQEDKNKRKGWINVSGKNAKGNKSPMPPAVEDKYKNRRFQSPSIQNSPQVKISQHSEMSVISSSRINDAYATTSFQISGGSRDSHSPIAGGFGNNEAQSPRVSQTRDGPKNHRGHLMVNTITIPTDTSRRYATEETHRIECLNNRKPSHHSAKNVLEIENASNLEEISSRWGSTTSIASDATSESSEISPGPSWKDECLQALRSKIKPILLKNYLAVLICLAYSLLYSGTFVEFFMTSFALTNADDVKPFKAGLLVTMIGFSYMVTRLCYGYYVDLGMLKPSTLVAAVGLVTAVLTACAVFYTSYSLLVFFAFAFGSIGFAGTVLSAPLIMQILGVEDLGKMMTMCALVRAFLIGVQFPIHGLLYDATGDFTVSYCYVAVSYALSSVLLLSEPLVRAAQDRKVEHSGQKSYKQRMIKYIRPPLRNPAKSPDPILQQESEVFLQC